MTSLFGLAASTTRPACGQALLARLRRENWVSAAEPGRWVTAVPANHHSTVFANSRAGMPHGNLGSANPARRLQNRSIGWAAQADLCFPQWKKPNRAWPVQEARPVRWNIHRRRCGAESETVYVLF